MFGVIAAPERLPEWNPSVASAARVGGEVCLGSRAIMSGKLLGQTLESETEVIAFTPPSEFATRAIRGPRLTTRFSLVSQLQGTHVRVDVSGEVPGGMIGARLAEGFLRNEFALALQRLKALAEHEAAQHVASEPQGGDPACWLHLHEKSGE